MADFQVITQSFVNLTIITELNQFGVEKRYTKDIKIADLKNKLELITGYPALEMNLKLFNREKKFICDIDDDEKMLGI